MYWFLKIPLQAIRIKVQCFHHTCLARTNTSLSKSLCYLQGVYHEHIALYFGLPVANFSKPVHLPIYHTLKMNPCLTRTACNRHIQVPEGRRLFGKPRCFICARESMLPTSKQQWSRVGPSGLSTGNCMRHCKLIVIFYRWFLTVKSHTIHLILSVKKAAYCASTLLYVRKNILHSMCEPR